MKKILGKLLLFILVSIGVTGCMGVEEKQPTANEEKTKDSIQSQIIADLEAQYDMEFKIAKVFEGGITVGGRKVPTKYLIECVDDGTMFKYVLHDDGEIDNYYSFMRLGNDYYKEVLQEKLDSIYGKDNYVCQVLFSSDHEPLSVKEFEEYNFKADSSRQIKIYLGIKTENFQLDKESEKIAEIYNGLENFESKRMDIGFFENIPNDIEQFLSYETTGVNNTFSSFYLDCLFGETNIMSGFDGMVLSPKEVEKFYLTKERLEEI